ncbi:MAG: TetR/AcrR family transcriptional regulator [Actinomycetes bacterium]
MNGIVLYMVRLTNPVKERNRSLEQLAEDSYCPMRRRGDSLLTAIFQATISLLAEVGYSALSLEAVAHRAHTGKASLYRRWASKVDLVVDALDYEINKCEIPLDLTDLRAGLLLKINSMATAFAGDLGQAMAGCISEFQREPKLQQAAEEKIINPRKAAMAQSLNEGIAAGKIRPNIPPMVVDLPVAFMMHSISFVGRSPNEAEITNFVDTVMLPLLTNS